MGNFLIALLLEFKGHILKSDSSSAYIQEMLVGIGSEPIYTDVVNDFLFALLFFTAIFYGSLVLYKRNNNVIW